MHPSYRLQRDAIKETSCNSRCDDARSQVLCSAGTLEGCLLIQKFQDMQTASRLLEAAEQVLATLMLGQTYAQWQGQRTDLPIAYLAAYRKSKESCNPRNLATLAGRGCCSLQCYCHAAKNFSLHARLSQLWLLMT